RRTTIATTRSSAAKCAGRFRSRRESRNRNPAAGEVAMPVHETDVCIIGGGITSAMLAQKLSELRPGLGIVVVEAGRSIFDVENRGRYRERAIEYNEHPWPNDFVEDQQAAGIISMTMAVGGLALHWGGACNQIGRASCRE